MALPITLSEIGPRISAGAFILNSGLGKRGVDADAAAGIHGFAVGTYPFLAKVPPEQFAKGLAAAEIGLGAALLTPFVPTFVAGAALTAFSGGLLGLYLKTPGMRKEGSLAPTEQGLSIAKDSWMVGIGALLLTPFVPTAVAGLALTGFSGGLLGLYLKTPGMRKPGSLAPTEQGLAVAKDSWLVGIGIGLLTRGFIERKPRMSVKKAEKNARKQAKQAAKEARRAAK